LWKDNEGSKGKEASIVKLVKKGIPYGYFLKRLEGQKKSVKGVTTRGEGALVRKRVKSKRETMLGDNCGSGRRFIGRVGMEKTLRTGMLEK